MTSDPRDTSNADTTTTGHDETASPGGGPSHDPRAEAGPKTPTPQRENLAHVLASSWRSQLDATLPVIVFIAVWLLADHAILPAVIPAVLVAGAIAILRLARGSRPVGVLLGLLLVLAGSLIALYTGQAVDFFLPRVLTNAASALLFAVSIAARWPLLGLLVGGILGQRPTRWRRDPDLLRAYSIACWPWVGIYALRTTVFAGLYLAGWATALAIAQVALTWPLVLAALATSTWIIHQVLPNNHPGIRHPITETSMS